MHKGKSKSMQRGAIVRDRTYLSKEEFYAGTTVELTEAEVKHFHFGENDVASFVDRLEPTVRLYVKNGFRRPVDVSRLLNKEQKRTACGEQWSPRLTWFLLKLMFGSSVKPNRQRTQETEKARAPKKARILRPLAISENAATKSSSDRLTTDEIAKQLSSFARTVRIK